MAHEGFYRFEYQGVAGSGFGLCAFDTGRVVGVDVMGAHYDGTYEYNPRTDLLDMDVEVAVPAGVWLVQGVPAQQHPYSFPVKASVPRGLGQQTPVVVNVPNGPPVTVIFTKVRDFPT